VREKIQIAIENQPSRDNLFNTIQYKVKKNEKYYERFVCLFVSKKNQSKIIFVNQISKKVIDKLEIHLSAWQLQ